MMDAQFEDSMNDELELARERSKALMEELGAERAARENAERRLAETEREYRTLRESAGIAIARFDLGGKLISLNGRAAGYLDDGPENLVGKSVLELFPVPAGEKLLAGMRRVADSALPANWEDDIDVPKGPAHFHAVMTRVQDSDGTVVGILLVALEIAGWKRLEEDLRRAGEKFFSVFSSNPCALSINEYSAESLFIDCNQAFETLTGYSRAEIIGSSAQRLGLYAEPEDRQRLVEEMISRGSVRNLEFRYRRKNGEIGTGLQSVEPIDLGGNLCFIVASLDITARKRAEAEFERLNRELEGRIADRTRELVDLYDNAPCGYHSLDENGFIVRMNDTELRWLGYVRDEILGRMPFSDLLTESSRKTFSANYPVFMERGWLKDLELEVLRKDGSILPVLVNATAQRDGSGNFIRSRSSIVDNTDLKKAEETAKKALLAMEASNLELEAFSYSVSHDLRAPLRILDGFAERLRKEYELALDEEGKRLLSAISRNAKRMGELINDILAFSRIGRQEVAMTRLDMRAMAESAYRELMTGREEAGIEFRVSELPEAWGDLPLVRQVWINLIDNAIKFTARKQRRVIEISACAAEAGIEYCIRDNGAGFDMAYSDKLFGVFQRLHSVREFEGTGIGLSIVRRIVGRMEGKVWGEGRVDEGAAFHFILPAPPAWLPRER
jgi:PAS domain S-box-containing protein